MKPGLEQLSGAEVLSAPLLCEFVKARPTRLLPGPRPNTWVRPYLSAAIVIAVIVSAVVATVILFGAARPTRVVVV